MANLNALNAISSLSATKVGDRTDVRLEELTIGRIRQNGKRVFHSMRSTLVHVVVAASITQPEQGCGEGGLAY